MNVTNEFKDIQMKEIRCEILIDIYPIM